MAYEVSHINFVLLTTLLMAVHDSKTDYTRLHVGNDKLCSLVGVKREHKLKENGLIVYNDRTFHSWSGRFEFKCTFKLNTDFGDPVIAVVQKLDFRNHLDSDECIDYVQFKCHGKKGPKLCGLIDVSRGLFNSKMEKSDLASKDFLPNGYICGQGGLDVTIFVDNKPVENLEKLELLIAFTPQTSGKNRFSWRKGYINCGNDVSISEYFERDGVVNCPFKSCADEHGCGIIDVAPRGGSNKNVVIGSIMTLVLMFTGFFVCICVLRHFRKCCFTRNCASGNLARTTELSERGECLSHSEPLPPEEETLPSTPPNTSFPSAPPKEDLPPSYESLFPTNNK